MVGKGMNIDYLDLILSASMTLRKMKSIVLEQKNGPYNMRPQMHILIVSPFGTFKSSITKMLEIKFNKNIYPIDDFTKASIEGSIGKDGDYVPSLIIHLGGKILVVDEFNNIDFYAQKALLGVLENQRVNRVLGFKVRSQFKFRNKYGYFKVKDNVIQGGMFFSCIAYAMNYPIYNNSQEAKALLSRFCPLFIEPTVKFMSANTKGEFEINIKDYSKNVESVVIKMDCYLKFHKLYYEFFEKNELYPSDTDDYGFISRILSDVLRLGIFNYLSKNNFTGKELIIDDETYFVEMFPYIHTLIQQYMNPSTKNKFMQYRKMLRKFPNRDKKFYYTKLGISRQTLWEYDKRLEEKNE
jgi:hypothetical protein